MGKTVLAVLVLASGLAAGELAEKWSKRLESADANYQQAIQKADNVRFYAVQKATQERVKVLKTALADATKAGDFDAATEIKSRLAAAETAGVRPRPKNVVKFGGHEYALIEDKSTWHVAKRACEEMGGHLATLATNQESDAVLSLCKGSAIEYWIGATDEAAEGQWRWTDGSPVKIQIHQDNAQGIQHYLLFHTALQNWDDGDGGARHSFICEWDN